MAVVRRQLGTRAVGHAGTLDPFATGLLVVLVGRATRLARFVEGMAKEYRAVVRFGSATDTDDGTGQVTQVAELAGRPTRDEITAITAALLGPQQQRPPAYSAKHVAGTRSHVLARRGTAVELPDVTVQIHGIDVLEWSPPDLTIDARVGRGTYIRALARDIGERVGIPAHCAMLRRLAIGSFDVANAIAPGDATAARLMPAAAMVPHLAQETVDAAGARELGSRTTTRAKQSAVEATGALLAADGRLLAVAEGREGWWHPVVVLEPAA